MFVQSRDLGTELAGMLRPGEALFQWGNEPELYVYTARLPPTGMMWAQDVQHGPLRVPFRMRMLAQLSAANPDLIVASRGQPLPTGALGRWFAERYRRHPFIRRRRGFTLWVRRGGPLERRILSPRREAVSSETTRPDEPSGLAVSVAESEARRQRTRPRAATFQVPSTFPRRP